MTLCEFDGRAAGSGWESGLVFGGDFSEFGLDGKIGWWG